MTRLERNLNRIGGILGIILLITIVIAMSSCSPYGSLRMKMKYGTNYYPCGGQGVN